MREAGDEDETVDGMDEREVEDMKGGAGGGLERKRVGGSFTSNHRFIESV